MNSPQNGTPWQPGDEATHVHNLHGSSHDCNILPPKRTSLRRMSFWVLMIASVLANLVGGSAGALLGRLYFVHGGSKRWLYTWLESAAWPILLPLLWISYWKLSIRPSAHLNPKFLLACLLIGLLLGIDNLLYAWGLSYLPLSTNSLLSSSQLAFTVVFSYLLVQQRLSGYIINSVFIITISAVLLGLQSSSDRPPGITTEQYNIGFVLTILAAALFGLLFPLTQLAYRFVENSSFVVVLELQIGISIAATIFAMVGMWIDGTFPAIRQELRQFDLGAVAYCMTLVWGAIGWQLFGLGSFGIVYLSSSLTSCVFTTATLPVVPILSAFFFHDEFTALKAMSLLLSVWGFLSYVYDGFLDSRKVPSPTIEQHNAAELSVIDA